MSKYTWRYLAHRPARRKRKCPETHQTGGIVAAGAVAAVGPIGERALLTAQAIAFLGKALG